MEQKTAYGMNGLADQLESALNRLPTKTAMDYDNEQQQAKMDLNHQQIPEAKPLSECIPSACEGATIWEEKDGSKTYEIQIPGKTSEDVDIELSDQGYLKVKISPDIFNPKERKLIVKVANPETLEYGTLIDPKVYDLDTLKSSVKNGLLSINIAKRKVNTRKIKVTQEE